MDSLRIGRNNIKLNFYILYLYISDKYQTDTNTMLIPVRCFTCGSVIANKWEIYKRKTLEGVPESEIFRDLNIKKYCCKRMFLGHVDLIDKMLEYEEAHPEEDEPMVLDR